MCVQTGQDTIKPPEDKLLLSLTLCHVDTVISVTDLTPIQTTNSTDSLDTSTYGVCGCVGYTVPCINTIVNRLHYMFPVGGGLYMKHYLPFSGG